LSFGVTLTFVELESNNCWVDRSTAKSRTGFIITYAGCPLTWSSKMQTEMALSTKEAKLIALSKGLWTAILVRSQIVGGEYNAF